MDDQGDKVYFYEIQIIRLIAAIFVVISHSGLWNTTGGAWSVSFFFVISGFLMAMHYKGESGRTLVTYNIKKLYPILFITMLIDFVILVFNGTVQLGSVTGLFGVFTSFCILQAWFVGFPRLNSVIWFYSALLFCILLAPTFIKKVLPKINRGGIGYV